MDFFTEMESKIPKTGVRTRFAPSPTGYMHVGGLRTALYAYLIAKKAGGTFILRIEDTDRTRYVADATEIIISTLKGAGLNYDEGPEIGGPVAPYTQSERKALYRPYAELLCEKDAAYYCFCAKQDGETENAPDDNPQAEPALSGTPRAASPTATNADSGVTSKMPTLPEHDPCRDLVYADSKKRVETGASFVIRMKAPREGETTVSDLVFGDVTTQNKTLDDMVLLKSDGMPTYNFANVVDDHLMGITHVLRGSEYISSAPKYNILYKAFGWEIPEYITVSLIMRDANNKLSKRHGDPTYDDLLKQGYLPQAVLNYVALLGWSPGGENEIFSLPQLVEAFEISGISKSPAIFDIEKLNHFNSEYIRSLPPEEFYKLATPYIKKAIKNEKTNVKAVAAILQARCEKLDDIPEKIDFFDKLPEYETGLFINKKSKTDLDVSAKMLKATTAIFNALPGWETETIGDALKAEAEKLEVKNATLMWPVRIAVSGKAVTPGGAVEICEILGREETLKRIATAIEKLSS